MLTIHGPTYRYSGERLRQPEMIYVQDHHYDDQTGYALQHLLDHSLCAADQHLLIFDHVNLQQEFDQYPHVCMPLLLAAETQEFIDQDIGIHWHRRSHAFNFMINKPRPNRMILLDMITDLGLINYQHSLCWKGGYRAIAATDFRLGSESEMERGLRNGSYRNAETYDRLLKSQVFEPTAVSLITEPAFHERETIITEKTLMAIWAGTVPIWVGGWRCADFMRASGFDVFDDIVDHGYQSLGDPAQRCQCAISHNIQLLQSPLDLEPLQARLRHNLDLLLSNVFLQQIREITARRPKLDALARSFRGGYLASALDGG